MNKRKISSVFALACLLISSCGQIATPAPVTNTPEVLPPAATATETPPPSTPTPSDTGWQGEYFNNDAFQGTAVLTRTDADLNLGWGDASPDPGIPADYFSVRWTRCLDLEERAYTFTGSADDHIRVLLDNVPILDTSFPAGRSLILSAGRHCIIVEYQEAGGAATVNFTFQPGEPYTAGEANGPWQGEYFNNPNFQEPSTVTRNDAEPVFDWKDGNPAPSIPFDGFSVRWTRCLELEGRDYVFTAHADDGVRVFLDDAVVLEASIYGDAQKSIPVSAGSHCIKLEYVETTGPAAVSVSFQ